MPLTWNALFSHRTEQEVRYPMRWKLPEIRLVSFSQQPNTSYGLLRTRERSEKSSGRGKGQVQGPPNAACDSLGGLNLDQADQSPYRRIYPSYPG